jgi:crossover junction endodeoxyribonuclease RuvC
MQHRDVCVLAIDPGYGRLGVALLSRSGENDALLYSDCIETLANTPLPERLLVIGTKIEELIARYNPSEIAIEQLFFNSNQKTALAVAEARGAVTYVAVQHGLVFFEYTPLQIKMALTGYGRATKSQVIAMIPQLISIPTKKAPDDEYDAIAVGLTHLASRGAGSVGR